MVVPFIEAGPGELLVFQLDDEDVTNQNATEHVAQHPGEWVGYLYVRHAVVRSGGRESNAVLLEGWWHSVATHVVCRYRQAEDGAVLFLEGPTMVSEAPPNRLLDARTRVSSHELRGMRDRLLATAGAATPRSLVGCADSVSEVFCRRASVCADLKWRSSASTSTRASAPRTSPIENGARTSRRRARS